MRTTSKIEIAVSAVAILMVTGTVAFHFLENWSYVDSFYFTGVTLTTIGYGDIYPTHDISKVFTVIFAFTGVGIFAFALSVLAGAYVERREKKMSDLFHRQVIDAVKKSQKFAKKKRKEIIKGSRV